MMRRRGGAVQIALAVLVLQVNLFLGGADDVTVQHLASADDNGSRQPVSCQAGGSGNGYRRATAKMSMASTPGASRPRSAARGAPDSGKVLYAQSGGLHSWVWSRVSVTATTAEDALEALHTVSVVHAIRILYSIHNPGHDYNRLLHKYWGEELDDLLAAVAEKYVRGPARARLHGEDKELPKSSTGGWSSADHPASLPLVAAASALALAVAVVAGTRWRRERRRNRKKTKAQAFWCPISLEPMVDPVVVVESGQTYERAAIEQWFRTHDTDPVSNVNLTSKNVSPNHALRHAIEDFPRLVALHCGPQQQPLA